MHQEGRILHYLTSNRTLSGFYVMMAIRGFALAMINIFIPIFIYTLRNSLFDVAVFFIFAYLVAMVLSPVAAKLTSKVGNVHTMLVSIPFSILFFLSLYVLNPLQVGIPLLGVSFGIYEAIFWISFHEEFSALAQKKKAGKKVGLSRAITIGMNLVGPIAGGLLIVFVGFDMLFLIVIGLLSASMIPLLLSKDIKTGGSLNLKKIYVGKRTKFFKPFIGHGANILSMGTLWPLFVFIIIQDYVDLGAMTSVIALISALVALFIGSKSDKGNKKKMVNMGSKLYSLPGVLSGLVRTAPQAFGAWAIRAVLFPIFVVPFETIVYESSKTKNILEFFVMREHAMCIGRFIILGLMLIFAANPQNAMLAVMVSGGLLTALHSLK